MRIEKNIEERNGKYIVYFNGKYCGMYETIEEARAERDSRKKAHISGKRTAYLEGFTERFNKAIWESNKDITMISRQSKISRSVIWSYQNGVLPKCNNLAKLAIVLNVSTDYLLGIER